MGLSMSYALPSLVEGTVRMLMSFEPYFLLAPVPSEIAAVAGGALVTAIAAQWRAREKDREASIAAITKNSLTQDRLLTSFDTIAKDVADIKTAASHPSAGEAQIITLLTEIRKELQGSGGHRAASG